jgi:dihydrolipoamide dehydrogenase
MPDTKFDVIIIGGGPGGYLAAERAGAAGKKTLLVEKDQRLGGVCLNRGCIPTKALLNSAKIYHLARHSAEQGVSVDDARFDLARAMAWKAKTVTTLTKGVEYRMKRHGVQVVTGAAKLRDRGVVSVEEQEYRAADVIIATGSSPVMLTLPGAEQNRVLTSDELLEIRELPGNLAIVGGGVIGIEFASLFTMLGVGVTVVEMLPEILPNFDPDIAALMRSVMKGCTFLTGSRVVAVEAGGVRVATADAQMLCPADMVLLAVGRKPNVNHIGLEEAGVDFDATGIRVDDRMRTNLPNVYAVGDVTGRSLLAHSAYRMGEVAVNTILQRPDRMRYDAIPWVVYGSPELSGVGLTEATAKKRGRRVKVASLQMRANGRFLAEHGGDKGICKVVVDAETDVLVGVTVMGGSSSEMIYGAAAMIEAEFRVKDVKDIVFPHPTVSEIIKDVLWELK